MNDDLPDADPDPETREIRVVRHTSGRKILSADDWRARTEAQAIEARLDVLRASLRAEVELEVRAELAEAFVRAAEFSTKNAEQERDALIETASACAERLVEAELTVEPNAIRGIVASVLEQATTEGPVSITVHPSVREHLRDVTKLAVHTDASLGVGDCLVDVRAGRFDGRLATRASRLVDFLKEQGRSKGE